MAKDREAARKAVQEYKAARAALETSSRRERAAGVRDTTDEYLRLNSQVVDAEKRVSFWRR